MRRRSRSPISARSSIAETDPLWLSRQSLEAAPTSVKPGCGWLPPSWLPTSLRRALRAASRDEADALTDYATPLGLPAMRQQLAWRLAQLRRPG